MLGCPKMVDPQIAGWFTSWKILLKKIDDLGVRFWCRCRKLLSGADLRTFQKSGLEPIPIDSIRQASAMSRSSGATRTPFSHITPLSTSPPMFFTAKPGRNGLPGCSLLLDLPNVGRGLAMAWHGLMLFI